MNYGLIRRQIDEEEKYIFGAKMLPRFILCEDGDWTKYLPEYEPQFNKNFDTYGCTVYGTINAVEMLINRILEKKDNYSERFHYNLIPIRPPGGDPHDVAESIRKNGMIGQEIFNMTDTFDEFIQPVPVPYDLIDEGKRWIANIEFGHEWLWKNNPSQEKRIAILKEALKYSPVGVSVTAWYPTLQDTYEDRGEDNNHWCVLVKIHEEDGRFFPVIFDSYDHELKTLSPEHHIEIAKRYHIEKKPDGKKRESSFWERLISFFRLNKNI